MAKGFSFVLVSVVMVMMTVFGMLSLSGAQADYRLSQRSAAAQTAYYGMDSAETKLLAGCEAACSAAGKDAQAAGGAAASEEAYFASLNKRLSALDAKAYGLDSITLTRGSGGTAVTAVAKGGKNQASSLTAVLVCEWSAQGTPQIRVTKWQAAVSGAEIKDDKKIKVFGS